MQLIEHIIRLVAPHNCIGCGSEIDRLVCEMCAETLALVPSRCYRCKSVTIDYETCLDCQPKTPLKKVVVYAHHDGITKELIHHMKYERAQAGMREAATMMQEYLCYFSTGIVLVHVPTATVRVRERGYDHAFVLIRELSRLSGLPRNTFLARTGQAHQVGANRTQRLRQLEGAFRAVNTKALKDKHIVLVDDVLTTGATLETAARMLKRAGAKRVDALVFAQA